jgi:hypothetical protein
MLKEVIELVPDKPERVPLPDEVLQYLRSHQIPADIIEDLAASSYDNWIPIGPVHLIPMSRLIHETSGIAVCIEHGLLPVAGCRNFDPVVVNRQTRRVSYVSHDLLWSDDWDEIAECLQDTPFNYDDFWKEAFSDPSFPIDYYDAAERWSGKTRE